MAVFGRLDLGYGMDEVSGTTRTVPNLLRLIESRCTTTTGLLDFGSDPFDGWRFTQNTSPWHITIQPPHH